MVGIICPTALVEIGLKDLPKSGSAMAPPAPPDLNMTTLTPKDRIQSNMSGLAYVFISLSLTLRLLNGLSKSALI